MRRIQLKSTNLQYSLSDYFRSISRGSVVFAALPE